MVLHVLGLTPTEEELYERLVGGPPMAAGQAEAVHLRRLLELGLVTELPGDPPRWTATPPAVALEVLIGERSLALAEAARYVADLDRRFHRTETGRDWPPPVEVIYGREEILRRGPEFQRRVRAEIRACDGPPYPEANPAAVNTMELDHLRSGIRYRVLYDRRALDVPGRPADLEAGLAAGEEARVTDIPLKMTLVDDAIAILPLHQPADIESRLVVYDPVLLTALGALFEMYWDRALPLRVSGGKAQLSGAGTGPSEREAHLLPLLVAGLTDQEIAAHLKLSDRTVRSRVRAMTARLDATTRFQAGYQSVARGWLGV